jgi:hypothetical protein
MYFWHSSHETPNPLIWLSIYIVVKGETQNEHVSYSAEATLSNNWLRVFPSGRICLKALIYLGFHRHSLEWLKSF